MEIKDDFDLDKIARSGQCFRVKKFADAPNNFTYRFITRGNVLYIRQLGANRSFAGAGKCAGTGDCAGAEKCVGTGESTCAEERTGANEKASANAGGVNKTHNTATTHEYDVSCSRTDWQKVWVPYFDLTRNYADVRAQIPESDNFMRKAADAGLGIRILRQDAWEMLITFIISQRKSIPAIQKSVEMICERFGSAGGAGSHTRIFDERTFSGASIAIDAEQMFGDSGGTEELIAGAGKACAHNEGERTARGKRACAHEKQLHLFPTPEQMFGTSLEDLQACKLGYRAPYVQDAVRAVCSGELDLHALESANDVDLVEQLKTVRGVGDKVANCVALFAYGRVGLAPVDTWIQKIIDAQYGGENPFTAYGDVAGIMQQYAFFWAQENKGEF